MTAGSISLRELLDRLESRYGLPSGNFIEARSKVCCCLYETVRDPNSCSNRSKEREYSQLHKST